MELTDNEIWNKMSEDKPRFNGICLIVKLVEVETWIEDKPVQIQVLQVVESNVDPVYAYDRARELGNGCMVLICSGL